jgi:hypothetical protein
MSMNSSLCHGRTAEPAFTIRRVTASDIPVLAHHRAAMFSDMEQLSAAQREPMTPATAAYLRKAFDGLSCMHPGTGGDSTNVSVSRPPTKCA